MIFMIKELLKRIGIFRASWRKGYYINMWFNADGHYKMTLIGYFLRLKIYIMSNYRKFKFKYL